MATKKLPFKPTALRNVKAPSSSLDAPDSKGKGHGGDDDDDDDGLALFRQSKAMAPILAADQERRLKKKQKQKQKQLEELRRQSVAEGKRPAYMTLDDDDDGPAVDDKLESTPSSRDLYSEEPGLPECGDGDGDGDGPGVGSSRALVTPPSTKRSNPGSAEGSRSPKRQRSDEIAPTHSPPRARSSETQSPTKRKALSGKDSPVIVLDSDSDDDARRARATSSTKQAIASGAKAIKDEDAASFEAPVGDDNEEEALVSDQLKAEAEQAKEEEEGDNDNADDDDDDDDEFSEYVRRAQQQRDEAAARTSKTVLPPVWILVTSEMPSTRPLLCKYSYKKALKVLRDTWVATQVQRGIDLQQDDVTLTWCRRKLYPSTSLLTLNIRPPAVAGGAPTVGGGDRARGFSKDGAQVWLEAWTSAGFRDMELEEHRRQRRETGDVEDEDDDNDNDDEGGGGSEGQKATCAVRLAAKGLAPVEVTVPLDATVGFLVREFRRRRGVPEDKHVAVWLEGCQLQESETMADAGVDDDVMLEVYIK